MKFSHQAVNGITLHVAQAGPRDGTPVFLLHGFPEAWFAWRRQIGVLAGAGFAVAAPDQRGYGYSEKPTRVEDYRLDVLAADVLALADSLGYERFSVVGHDWGASVGWWLATHHPDRMERLVALNAPHPALWYEAMRSDPVQRRKSRYVQLFRLPWVPERLLRFGDFRALRSGFADATRKDAFTPEDLALYRETWSEPGALSGMLNWYRALLRYPPGRAPNLRIAVPTLVIWGARDRYAGAELAQVSVQLCEQGTLFWVDRASHWVQHDEPDEVSRLCCAFLGRRYNRNLL
jgi:pimeloyl-ACP methyl ester carboxylesterase